MGTLVDFTCPACGLKGHVSGGGDCGVLAATTTIYCETCDNLQDAVVVKNLLSIPHRHYKPRCEKSKSHSIILWNRNEPCPRCGRGSLELAQNGLETLWD